MAIPEINHLADRQREKAAFIIEMFLTHIVNPKDDSGDSHFSLIMKWFTEEGIVSIDDITHEFNISKPTARRWAMGLSRPHQAIRGVVYKWLIEKNNKFLGTNRQL